MNDILTENLKQRQEVLYELIEHTNQHVIEMLGIVETIKYLNFLQSKGNKK